jgi:indolepyruvate ferredoxin oxidoreductase beta subunit
MRAKKDFLLAGVGGQGTLLASDVLVEVGSHAGYEAKKSEIHGMAQRGGSVTSHVRWGEKVYSPFIGKGEADYFLAFEKLEAVRHVESLRPGGIIIVNDYRISPVSVSSGGAEYPDDARVRSILEQVSPEVHFIPGLALAGELGNTRISNVVLLGALSRFLDVPVEIWIEALAARVPQRFIDINEQAFRRGRETVQRPYSP